MCSGLSVAFFSNMLSILVASVVFDSRTLTHEHIVKRDRDGNDKDKIVNLKLSVLVCILVLPIALGVLSLVYYGDKAAVVYIDTSYYYLRLSSIATNFLLYLLIIKRVYRMYGKFLLVPLRSATLRQVRINLLCHFCCQFS